MTAQPEFVGIDGEKRKITSKDWDVVWGTQTTPCEGQLTLDEDVNGSDEETL